MVITTIKVEGKEKPLYMDGTLFEQLNKKVIPSVMKKDSDWVVAVDGMEGSGKSVLAMQIAKVVDPKFCNDNIAFNAPDFISKVVRAKKGSCIVFDEAFTGLSSRTSLSEINNLLVSLMMEMRQKNLFVIIVMPTFFMLDKYCVLHRARGLFHVYTKNNKRGFWSFFNKERMKYLYLKGKKFYTYTSTKPILFGRFQDQYTVNEEEYRSSKTSALHKKKRATRAEVYKSQRDVLFWLLIHEYKKTQVEITFLCKKWGYKLDRSTISAILKDKKQQLMIEEALQNDSQKNVEKNAEKTEIIRGNPQNV